MKKHRYFVTITRAEYYSDDEIAIEMSKLTEKVERKTIDNDCVLVSITRQDHGQLEQTEIFNKNK